MPPALDYLRKAFLHFAEICDGQSPLYAALSRRIAGEPEMLRLGVRAAEGQPPVNLIFGAVHFLLLDGIDHPLAAFYPSVGGGGDPVEAWPSFADFCAQFRNEIVELVATRRVQTNEVGRCGVLMPAFARAQRMSGGRPLHLVEIGSSAGLNLLFDRYRYEYSNGRSLGPASPVVIRTELLDQVDLLIPDDVPRVAGRIGVDIAPVEVMDDDAMRWIAALIWPDQIDRRRLLQGAINVARQSPPALVAADGLEIVEELVQRSPAEHHPCVFHSHATFQMSDAWRSALGAELARIGSDRDLSHVSLEWLDDAPGPQLHLTIWRGGRQSRTHLADCHHHGRWLRAVMPC